MQPRFWTFLVPNICQDGNKQDTKRPDITAFLFTLPAATLKKKKSYFSLSMWDLNVILLIVNIACGDCINLCPHCIFYVFHRANVLKFLLLLEFIWLFVVGLWVRGNFRDAWLYLCMQTCSVCFINTSVTPEVQWCQMLTFILNDCIYSRPIFATAAPGSQSALCKPCWQISRCEISQSVLHGDDCCWVLFN